MSLRNRLYFKVGNLVNLNALVCPYMESFLSLLNLNLFKFIAPRKGHSSIPSFRPMSVVATVAHLSYC